MAKITKAKIKCTTCDGKGWYFGVIPPGRTVKSRCFCKNSSPEKK